MGYIGNQTSNSYTSLDKQTITGDGGASYTLDHAVANVNEIEVFVNNVRQEPSVAYTVSGTALTMTGNVDASDDFYVVFQGKALQTTVPPDDSVTTARINDDAVTTDKIADDAVTAAKLADTYQGAMSFAVLRDKKAYNVEGGAASAGWNDRDLNEELFDPDGIVTLSSNQFTLGAGTYIIRFSAPVYRVNRAITALYDVTNSAYIQRSPTEYANSSYNGYNNPQGVARVVITANTTYKIQSHCQSAYSSGLGLDSNKSGQDSIYTVVEITKLA
jgi:hypothetical protein